MPGDTIWLNDTKTEYILASELVDNPDTAKHHYSSTYKSEFESKRDFYSDLAFPCTVLLLVGLWIIIRIRDGRSRGWVEIGSGRRPDDNDNEISDGAYSNQEEIITDPCLNYEGSALAFSNTELRGILNKRSPYFNRLNPFEKEKFIKRLKQFINSKVFRIHDSSGFKEMPILISGAAIQLSFGLENYLLPDFAIINIYPQEFLGIHPNIRFLEGNVSGNSINISWKHFLTGFELPDDGQNVGLHEMAHAYYFQNLECRKCEDTGFKKGFASFEQNGNKVFLKEQEPGNDLYSEYAMKNFQEFWAETIEVFFEKPVKLKSTYPELYATTRELLNQDTARYQP